MNILSIIGVFLLFALIVIATAGAFVLVFSLPHAILAYLACGGVMVLAVSHTSNYSYADRLFQLTLWPLVALMILMDDFL